MNEHEVVKEPVMSEEEFIVAQREFMNTVQAAGWKGMTRNEFIQHLVMGYASTIPYGQAATRLIVHYYHMLEGLTEIDPTGTATRDARIVIRAYYARSLRALDMMRF